MAKPEDIGWGSYKLWEGPFYPGKHKMELSSSPSEDDLILAVITATEGGTTDAYNGYDSCICSSGLIQWCERYFAVSNMLGEVAEKKPALLKPVDDICLKYDFEFQKNKEGNWRFHFKDDRGEVDTVTKQVQQFFFKSQGLKGTWDNESKQYAKEWAAAISTVWEHNEAKAIQASYTIKRLHNFAATKAQAILNALPSNNLGRATRAAYLSFAANNPTWAREALEYAVNDRGAVLGSLGGMIEILRQLTFKKGITIYPHRYNAIRPVLEKLYNINLPDFSNELKTWQRNHGMDKLWDTKEIQEALLFLGYDLGPYGVDGKWGKKTEAALLSFELHQGKAGADGKMDADTARLLGEAVSKLGRDSLQK